MASNLHPYIQWTSVAAMVLSLAIPMGATAQVGLGGSPTNAGQNSGNNTSGSSSATISTPNFTPTTVVPVVTGVSISPTGTVTAPPAVIASVNAAVQVSGTTTQGSILAPILTSSSPAPLSGPQAQIPDVSVGLTGGSLQIVPLVGVAGEVTPIVRPGSLITVTRPSTGTTGTISVGDGVLQVSVRGQSIGIPTTIGNQVAVAQFAAVAIAAGFAPLSISLGGQLVSIGSPVPQTLQLMAGLQGLAVQPDLTALATGITAFNTIVETTSPTVLSNLASSEVFIGASTTLRNARAALAGAT